MAEAEIPVRTIRLAAQGVLRAGHVLGELGKLNVICGRNNSGKTTVLRAIANPASNVGQSGSDATFVSAYLAEADGWVRVNQYDYPPAARAQFRKIITGVLESRSAWFADDGTALATEVQHAATREHFAYADRIADNAFRDQTPKFFPAIPPAVILPPSRHVTSTATITGKVDPLSDGSNLVAYLHWAGTTHPNLPDKKLVISLEGAFRTVTRGYSFSTFAGDGTTASLHFSDAANHVAADDSGEGLRQVLQILFFALKDGPRFLGVEEPEINIHPEMQRRLVAFLKSDAVKKQLFLTTHSSVFLGRGSADRVFYTEISDGMILVRDDTSRVEMLEGLGYSPAENVISDLVVLVEGKTDADALRPFFVKRNILPRFSVQFWPLSGDDMVNVDLGVFKGRTDVVALIDRDDASKTARSRFVALCGNAGIPVTQLRQRLAIENYMTPDAIRSVVGLHVKSMPDTLNPDVPVEKQLGGVSIKGRLYPIANAMTLEDLRGTDLGDFIDAIFTRCEEGLRASS